MDLSTTSDKTEQYRIRLTKLGNLLCDNIDYLLDTLGVTYRNLGNVLVGPCPIHHGDNPGALNIYPDGDTVRGIWRCNTKSCHRKYQQTIIGFVRGVLQSRSSTHISLADCVQWCCEFLKLKSLTDIDTYTIKLTTTKIKLIQPTICRTWTKQQSRSLLQIPCQYYLNRGYLSKILDKYDVGTYNKLYRAVAPIYSHNYKNVVGFTGRSIFEKCPVCNLYHASWIKCPKIKHRYFSKWLHSKGFPASEYLYNLWFAKDYILKSKTAILVESPGNVWKLEQNDIHNSVATFGCNLSESQRLLLVGLNIHNIIIIFDNDSAGLTASLELETKLNREFNVRRLIPENRNDLGEMTDDEVKKLIQKLP